MLHVTVTPVLITGVVLVVMVTAAPLVNEEKIGSVDQSDPMADQVKRADEEIYFGNQQNEARGFAKKSIDMTSPDDAQLDAGAVVMSHEETPVEKDLAQRAEMAKGKSLDEASNEAYEYAMHQAVQKVIDGASEEKSDSQNESDNLGDEKSAEVNEADSDVDVNESNPEEAVDKHEDKTVNKVAEETDNENHEETNGEEASSPESLDESESSNTENKRKQTADEETVTETTDDVSAEPSAEDPAVEAGQFQDEERILQEIPYTMDFREESILPPIRNEEYRMPGFLGQIKNQYQAPRFGIASQWRPLSTPYFDFQAQSQNPGGRDRRRRIKRDLLDDEFGEPYSQYQRQYALEPSYVPEEYTSEDSEVPWSKDDVNYVYSLFLAYLEEKAEEELEKEREREILSDLPYWVGSDDSADVLPDELEDELADHRLIDDYIVPYLPEEDEAPSEYEPSYSPQEMEDSDITDTGVDKRVYGPITGEPEEPEQSQANWGEFVPEKRDYSQAVERLQRLALALSDNQGGYYKDMIEDYKRR